jgi:hypothetical protein
MSEYRCQVCEDPILPGQDPYSQPPWFHEATGEERGPDGHVATYAVVDWGSGM